MAFNNYFPQGYQPMQMYPQQMVGTQMSQPQQASSDIKWVQGEAGAKSYMVAPNTSVTLWDSESHTIYIKSANASGLPSMTVIDYTIRNESPQNKQILSESEFATKDDISHLRAEIEALRAKYEATEGSVER